MEQVSSTQSERFWEPWLCSHLQDSSEIFASALRSYDERIVDLLSNSLSNNIRPVIFIRRGRKMGHNDSGVYRPDSAKL